MTVLKHNYLNPLPCEHCKRMVWQTLAFKTKEGSYAWIGHAEDHHGRVFFSTHCRGGKLHRPAETVDINRGYL